MQRNTGEFSTPLFIEFFQHYDHKKNPILRMACFCHFDSKSTEYFSEVNVRNTIIWCQINPLCIKKSCIWLVRCSAYKKMKPEDELKCNFQVLIK